METFEIQFLHPNLQVHFLQAATQRNGDPQEQYETWSESQIKIGSEEYFIWWGMCLGPY